MIMVLGAAIGAIGGLFGQRQANKANLAEARRNRQFQSQQAGRQMQFQERMRNTAWQAAMADMQAAGINPALALAQGPAASPGGASGAGSQAAPQGDVVSSAMQGAQMSKTLDIMDQTLKKTRHEARAARAAADIATSRSGYLTNVFTVNGRRSAPAINELVQAEVDAARAGATNMQALSDRNRQLARIAAPMGDLSEQMGTMLPILTGLVGAAGPAGNFIRSMRRRRGGGRRFSPR